MLNNGFINLFKKSPFFIAGKLLEENKSRLPAKAKKIKVSIFRFIFII